MDTSKLQPPSNLTEPSVGRLDSWKEIAAYLKRDERTVRRWEAEGLPVHRHMHKKQASIYAYAAEVDAWWNNGRQRLETAKRRPASRSAILWLCAGLAAAVLTALVVFNASGLGKRRWARNQALPEIARLLDQGQADKAFRLAREAERYIPDDPLLVRLLRGFTVPVSIQTTPPGAEVYVKTYSANNEEWFLLGTSPLENVRVPGDYLRLKIAKRGFGTLEQASSIPPYIKLEFTLDIVGASPADMVRIPGGILQFHSAGPVALEPYWLDKYEVTNQQFKDFIDRGGYQNRLNWKQEFVKNGHRLSWNEAMAEFRDSTGRVAPSTWEMGSFPDGQADFPVGGVSWYEAGAYCEAVGKSLPSVYHWYKAAGLGIPSDILHFSNFGEKGPNRIGVQQGLGPYGTYDMAGNVKEWTWNKTGSKRYILGGAWNEPSYMFATEDARSPFSRAATFGFRCAKYISPPAASLTRPAETLTRDYRREKPVADSVFNLYKGLYAYDHTDLEARVESVDNSSEYWRRERVTFNAAYGNERVIAYLFLPKNARPPYATVISFPGVSAFFQKSSENVAPDRLEFALRSGRAVLYPIYMGTYERRITTESVRRTPEEVIQPGSSCLPVGPNAAMDLVSQWAKDLGRSIDYLETREDIDSHRLAYFGLSLGAVWGPVLTAVEPRIKVSVLAGGGLPFERLPSQIEPLNFAPRTKIPTLMLNGRDDFIFPVETSQIPLFRLLGSPSTKKRHLTFDSGHVPPWQPVVKESLDWLDRYL